MDERIQQMEADLAVLTGGARMNAWQDIIKKLLFTDPSKMMAYARQMLAEVTALDEQLPPDETDFYRSYAHNALGNGHYFLGEFGEAIQYHKQALEIRQRLGDDYYISTSLNNLGAVYEALGDFDQALDYHLQALKLREKIDDKTGISASLNNIGNIYQYQRQFDLALEYYQRSLTIKEEINDTVGIGYTLNNIGNLYDTFGDYEIALDYYRRSLKIHEDNHNLKNISATLGNIGQTLIKQLRFDEAEPFLSRSLEISEDLQDKNAQTYALKEIAKIHQARGDYQQALQSARRCLIMAQSINSKVSIRDAHDIISRIYLNQKKYKQALLSTLAYNEIHNQIFDDEMRQKIQQITVRYETEKKEREAEIYRLKNVELVRLNKELAYERERSEKLLQNILPEEVAEELKDQGYTKPRLYDQVTVLFTDFKGFTKFAAQMTPEEIVKTLNECFIAFDDIIARYDIEKIKTIGDAYMCAGGIPTPNETHPFDVVRAALEMRDWMANWKREKEIKHEIAWDIRIGIHTGPIVAGVVGKTKFAYDIWGDVVNVASRMESGSEPGRINISGETYERIKDHFECEYRGKIHAKNRGEVDMYFVNG